MLSRLIETPRLLLRASEAGEGSAINAAIAETFEQLRDWMPWAREMPTLEQSQAYAQEAARKWEAGTQFDFSILTLDGGFVGRVGIWPLEEDGSFEIGYWCRASRQGQGYASEAVRALCESARKYLQPSRLIIRCDRRNIASQNVALRCGFALGSADEGEVAGEGSTQKSLMFELPIAAST